MTQGRLGVFQGTTTPDVNMLDIFKENELKENPLNTLRFSKMRLVKFGIMCPKGTILVINGEDIPVSSGHLEFGYGMLEIHSLSFKEAVDVDIMYMY